MRLFKPITIIFFALFLCGNLTTNAQTKRAFLVGIDNYNPGKIQRLDCRKCFSNLYGCINDVDEMAGILEARYQFNHEDIHTLRNENATRDNILTNFETYLIHEAAPNDICVFYYSGHGSQVKNSKSNEPDHLDETIVPSDSYRGVKDIRDKELKKLFNRALDKHVQLTVIMDSCHSGSISRGISVPARSKFLPPEECDIADPPDNDDPPSKRGALIFSATQDFDRAVETEDENNNSHGLFTWALLNVLKSAPIDESAEHIKLRVNALIKSEGNLQEPNLEGSTDFRMKPLFGVQPGDRSTVTAVVIHTDKKGILLQGGIAAGILKNCELKKCATKDSVSDIRVRVTEVQGLNRCMAQVIQGNLNAIETGDLFEMERWVSPPEKRLNIRVPASPFSFNELTRFAQEMNRVRNFNRVEWIEDPTEKSPDYILFWNDSQWVLKTPKDETVNLGSTVTANDVIKHMRSTLPNDKKKAGFFLQLPLSSEWKASVQTEIADCNDSVELVSSSIGAHYLLVGRFTGNRIDYAWVLPNTVRDSEKEGALPVRTDWITAEKPIASKEVLNQFKENVFKLARIRAWLQLTSPSDSGVFPYRLALKHAASGEITAAGPLREGETYGLILQADKEKLGQKIEKRYVYVFVIDSNGKGTLLFPSVEQMNSENHFPVQENDVPTEIALGNRELFNIQKPFGIDNYILLTTAEPISDPGVLDFSGVKRGTGKRNPSPLEKLLSGVGLKRSGSAAVTPMTWSIERLSILSLPQN